MALTRTARGSAYGGAGSDTVTTGSFTPSNNSLLVAFIGGIVFGPPTDITIDDTAGLTWTRRGAGGDQSEAACQIFTAPVTTGVSMTVSGHIVEAEEISISVVEYTGHDTSAPVVQTKYGGGASNSGAHSITLDASPASSSEVLAGVNTTNATAAITEGSGWTEVHEVAGGVVDLETEARGSSTSVTVAWTTVTCSNEFTSGAIEIKAAAEAGGQAPDFGFGSRGVSSLNFNYRNRIIGFQPGVT